MLATCAAGMMFPGIIAGAPAVAFSKRWQARKAGAAAMAWPPVILAALPPVVGCYDAWLDVTTRP